MSFQCSEFGESRIRQLQLFVLLDVSKEDAKGSKNGHYPTLAWMQMSSGKFSQFPPLGLEVPQAGCDHSRWRYTCTRDADCENSSRIRTGNDRICRFTWNRCMWCASLRLVGGISPCTTLLPSCWVWIHLWTQRFALSQALCRVTETRNGNMAWVTGMPALSSPHPKAVQERKTSASPTSLTHGGCLR